jgi:hypothetical protein
LAGLPTYSAFELPSRSFFEQWISACSQTILEFTAAGLSGIFTRFPFQLFSRAGRLATKTGRKGSNNFPDTNIFIKFISVLSNKFFTPLKTSMTLNLFLLSLL